MSIKRILPLLTVLALLSLLVTCRMESAFGPAPSATGMLPTDKVLDVARSYSGPFEYATLLPVQVNLTVDLYRQPSASAALERLSTDGELIIVILKNGKGDQLYAGSVPSGGTLSTVLSLPAAPEDAVLSLEAPGFEPRQVTIDGMVLYSEVNRVMSLLSKGISAKEALPDADGDGVPDVYDADPLNPLVTFVNTVPADGFLTVAFEDLYLVANAGDADYNDFVAKYRVTEYSGADGKLSGLMIEATAKAKLAGYNHDFGMVIDFVGTADISIDYYDASHFLYKTTTKSGVQNKAILSLFESTKDSINRTTIAQITFPGGVERSSVTLPPYDPYLYVRNTKYDIHLIGRESLPAGTYPVQNNPPGATFQDSKGFPWALLVPIEWQHPAETQYIGKAYPLFDRWRQSFGQEVPSWYLFRSDVPTDPNNHPPYPVTSDQGQEPTITIGSSSPYQLKINIPSTDTKPDPDTGDLVIFRSSLLPSFMVLDATTGAVTISPKAPRGDSIVYFWSEDEHGTSTIDNPYRVLFHLVPVSVNHPPAATFPPPGYGTSSAGITAANGYYTQSGTFNGFPMYAQTGGSYFIFKFFNITSPKWGIDTNKPNPETASVALTDISYYTANAITPPEDIWTTGLASAGQAPTVFRVPISGNLTVGNTLTAQYIFQDPDKDAEVGSHYQWYRFSNATETDTTLGTETGSDSKSYLTGPDDLNKWLRIQVIPVDEHGAAGTPVLSDAVKVIVGS